MPKISETKVRAALRDRVIAEFLAFAEEQYGTALMVKGNKFAVGVVDDNGDDRWAEVTIAIPTGSHDGTEQYDGEILAKDYAEHCDEVKAKAEERKRKQQAEFEARKAKAEEKRMLKNLKEAEKKAAKSE